MIDSESHTPIQHRFGEFEETFSDFVPLEDGSNVPLVINFQSRVDFQWQYQVFGNAIWVVKNMKHSSSTISAVEHDGKKLALTNTPTP